MRQNFLRVLLYVMLLGVPLSVRSVNWVPVGGQVQNGFAVGTASNPNSNVYHQGDNIDDAQHSYNNKSFIATADDNELNLYGTLYTDYSGTGTQLIVGGDPIPCTLKVNGNIKIEALDVDAVVNVNEDTTIIPFFDLKYTTSNGLGFSQVFFNTGLDGDGNPRVIDVNMYSDLTFSGTTAINGGPDAEFQDMIVTFAGPGMVRFNMSDGTSLWFDGQLDTTNAAGTAAGGLTYNATTQMFEWAAATPTASIGLGAAGCKVFVTMDQYQSEVDAGNCKLLFQRAILPTRAPVEQNTRVMVYFGTNAIFTYLSDNNTGIVDQDFFPDGYARVAFDPSCNIEPISGVAGRMVLFIQGAYGVDVDNVMDAKFPMNDGGVLINGHYCPDRTGPDGAYAPDDIISAAGYGYDFSTPAGVGAKFMVFDKTYYDNTDPLPRTVDNPYDPSVDDRRGLLVINDCQNISRLFADPYWDVQEADTVNYSGCSWAQSNPENSGIATRRGFVLGINGEVEIYPNTFLDHVSGAVNQVDPFEAFDILNPDAWQVTNPGMDLSFLKQRNPAAFIIDGLDPSLFDLGNPLIDPQNPPASDFIAADPLVQNNDQVRAMVSLYGDGALYSRACASSQYGYLYNFWTQADPLTNKTLDYTGVLDNGTGTYDAYQLSPNADTVQEGEGIHVYDFEGEGWIQGLYNTDAIDMLTGQFRFYTTEYTDAGVFSAPTVLIDDTGHEVLPEGGSYVWIDRPLLNDGTEYTRYNSPTVFFNNFGIFHNVIFKHTDATKYVNGVPAFSEPAITGGERYYFAWEAWSTGVDNNLWFADPNRFRVPEIRLIGNTTLELHESCCASGIRYTVLDLPNVPLSADGGDTYATVRFFDHGDPLDTMNTGYGRIWMLGSNMNFMADSVYNPNTETWSTPSRNYATDSCYLNIFKHNGTAAVTDPLDNASLVRLYLSNGDEFDPSVPEAQYDLQRAHHLIAISQPDEDIAFAKINAKIGWFTKQAYAGPFPGTYPYNDEDIATPADPFENDALVTPNSRLYVDGSFMCFTSFDKFGNSLPMPIVTSDDNGFLYVNSGGNLSIYPSSGDIHTQLQNHAIVSTGVAREIWNDSDTTGIYEDYEYSGQVYMPFDQVKFDPNYSIFIYNLTAQMWEDSQNPASGTSGVRIFPQEGEEEMGISWFWRELQNPTQYVPIKYPDNKAFNFRVTESPNMPVAETLDVVYFGGGDVIQQLKVFGATQSDPLHIGISGDGYSSPFYSDVREIVSCKSTTQATDRFISEGAHGVLFVELGGQVRLGSSEWNNHSVDAWNKLGKDYVTIVPMQGGGTVILNDNLLVTARMALVAGQTFGATTSDRLSFYSESPYEIRVPAGVELDLSSFGQTEFIQEIEFGGKVKLVLEAGATIRLPENGSNIALYFNDEAELVFEEPDALGQYVPFFDAAEADFYVTKIVGRGWFYVNKDAKILVNDNARVRIGTDELSPTTDIIFSLTRNGQFNIGNDTTAGGVLEIGDYAAPISLRAPAPSIKVKFLLADDSIFNIAREGCLALSTIMVNKNGNPNGSADPAVNPVMNGDVANVDSFGRPVFNPDLVAAHGAWSFVPAYNVDRIEFEMAGGTFDHKNIAQGDDNNASLIAVGPYMGEGEDLGYFFKLGSAADASLLGGGNVMFVPELSEDRTVYTANIWNYQGQVSTLESYGILGSSLLLLDRTGDGGDIASSIYGNGGAAFTFTTGSDFFNFLCFRPYNLQRFPKVDFAVTPFDLMVAYVSQQSDLYADTVGKAEIFRDKSASLTIRGNLQQAAAVGALATMGDVLPNEATVIQVNP